MSTVFLPCFGRFGRGRLAAPRVLAALCALLWLPGCAIRLGGTQPEEYRVAAVLPEAGAEPASVAERIRRTKADIAFVIGPGDSAWFSAVAAGTALHLSGPGRSGELGIAFLAGEALGDTTVSLAVDGGAEITVQDALYRVDDTRYLDLMALHLPAGVEARAAARALLAYIATDVMKDAAVVLAVAADSPAQAGELARHLEPALLGEGSCEGSDVAPADPPARLLYGPALQIRCSSVRQLEGAPAALLAEMVVRR